MTKAVRDWVRAQEQILLGYAGRELTPPTNFCFLEARLSFISHSVGAEAVQVLSAWPFLKACCRGWAVGIDSAWLWGEISVHGCRWGQILFCSKQNVRQEFL